MDKVKPVPAIMETATKLQPHRDSRRAAAPNAATARFLNAMPRHVPGMNVMEKVWPLSVVMERATGLQPQPCSRIAAAPPAATARFLTAMPRHAPGMNVMDKVWPLSVVMDRATELQLQSGSSTETFIEILELFKARPEECIAPVPERAKR